jgi:hypothetical protein
MNDYSPPLFVNKIALTCHHEGLECVFVRESRVPERRVFRHCKTWFFSRFSLVWLDDRALRDRNGIF